MKTLFVLAAATVAVSSFAQVNFSGSYSQNFNSLASAGTNLPWVDNLPTASMPGWYANTPPASYDADDGTNGTPGLYSYGGTLSTGLPDPERALGTVSLPGALLVFGMRLLNTSGGTFNSLTLGFTMEQWRSGSNLAETVDFEYGPSATSLMSGPWTSHNALDLNAVNFTGTGPIDGNLTGNKVALSSTITGLNWTSGTEMWVRWLHIGNGSNHGLAIDDMTMTANPVPEPFTMGLALAGLGLAARKRMRHRA